MLKVAPLRGQQKGMVSIIVTMMLMVVLSLIVLGFSRVARREQRQALDRQLSTQAFYAAEAGINDAINFLKTPPAGFTEKQQCGPTSAEDTMLLTGTVGDANYTCLLITTDQSELRYDGVGTTAQVIPLKANAAIRQVTINWQGTGANTTNVAGCIQGKNQPASWSPTCDPGLIRVDLVPIGNGTGLTRTNLLANTMTGFLYPKNSGSSDSLAWLAPPNTPKGQKADVVCDQTTGYKCSLTITGIATGNTQIQLRIQSFYKQSDIEIIARDNTGAVLTIDGVQAKIDSTGKSKDVLRRIQVRVPLNDAADRTIGDFAIQAADELCKQFSVWPNNFIDAQGVGGCSSP